MGTPYSFVGLGSSYPQSDIRTQSMANTAMATRHNTSINMVNPAGISGIDSMSFVGSIGAGLDNVRYRTSSANSQYSTAHINHIAIGFPLTKWWKTALYFTPYSNAGYEAFDHGSIAHGGNVEYNYKGTGGIAAINWGQAVNINKNLAIGVSAAYHFGSINNTKQIMFPDSTYIFSSQVEQKLQLSGFSWQVGTQYYVTTSTNSKLGIGLKYGLSSPWKSEELYSAIRFLGDDPFNNTTVDTIATWDKNNEKVKLPHILGLGFSWQYNDLLLLASDFVYEDWSQFNYQDGAQYVKNRWRASVGAEIIPESNNLSSYWKMVHYRLGFRYENLGIKFAEDNINEVALTAGMGLPLRRSKTFVNLGFELGQAGTISNNLIQSRFFKISLGITIKEKWFIKNAYF